MEKLQNLIKNNPQLKGDSSNFLKLAVKNDKGAVMGTGPHKLKLVSCENATNKDYQTQEQVKGVNLILEENGEQKKYFISTLGKDGKFHYLIEKFADIHEGTEIIMEYQRKPGSAKGFIDVKLANEEELPIVLEDGEVPASEPPEEDLDIPVINE